MDFINLKSLNLTAEESEDLIRTQLELLKSQQKLIKSIKNNKN